MELPSLATDEPAVEIPSGVSRLVKEIQSRPLQDADEDLFRSRRNTSFYRQNHSRKAQNLRYSEEQETMTTKRRSGSCLSSSGVYLRWKGC